MNRKHALAISALLGLAIAAGAFAATRGGQVGSEAAIDPLAGISLVEENARLDRYEATLDRLLDRTGPGSGQGGAGQPAAILPAATPTWDDDGDDDSGRGSDDDRYRDDDSGRGSDDDHGDDGVGDDD